MQTGEHERGHVTEREFAKEQGTLRVDELGSTKVAALSAIVLASVLSLGALGCGPNRPNPEKPVEGGFGPVAAAEADKIHKEELQKPGARHPEPTISDKVSGVAYDTGKSVSTGIEKVGNGLEKAYPWILNLGLMALIIAAVRKKDPDTEGWTEAGIMAAIGLLGISFDLPMTPMVIAAISEGGLNALGGSKVPWWIKFPIVFGAAAGALKFK